MENQQNLDILSDDEYNCNYCSAITFIYFNDKLIPITHAESIDGITNKILPLKINNDFSPKFIISS